METLSVSELYELMYVASEYGSNQFQYWLALTFALVGAAYVGGNEVGQKLKVAIAIVYTLSTLLLASLYLNAGLDYNTFLAELRVRGLGPPSGGNSFVMILRLSVWVAGTGLALFFLFHKKATNDGT